MQQVLLNLEWSEKKSIDSYLLQWDFQNVFQTRGNKIAFVKMPSRKYNVIVKEIHVHFQTLGILSPQ